MKIAHLSDIHIRFTSRENEYREVFNQTYEKLKEQNPDRIVVTGDLFHTKINMSPISTSLGGEFLTNLSKIAPVDIILGNHDMNERVLEQGNTIEPIVNLLKNGKTLEKEEVPISYFENGLYGIYLYKYGGYYTVSDSLIYGVYSIWDKTVLDLKKEDKKDGITYIALYHAPVYGCKMDNGMANTSSSLLNTSNFNNFDLVFLGDIHKYQFFDRIEGKLSMAYPGSLIQQSFGESIDKGYLLWNTETKTHERVLVDNDYGYCKIKIKNSEDLEKEVLKKLQFSKDPEKTKIYIEYEDREENYSLEKESNLINLIQEKFGCSSIGVSFVASSKAKEISKEDEEKLINSEFEDQLKLFLEEGGYDNKEDVLELSLEIEKTLNLKYSENFNWTLNKIEIINLFSMPNKLITIDFDKLKGITGILGENFSGKTNIIRSLIWIIWGDILGNGENKDAINIYSDSDNAKGTCYITINEVLYKIERSITRKLNKSTEKYACTYEVEFMYLNTSNEWVPVVSEDKSTGKTEVKNLINQYFGTYEDFTKVSLQVQNGEGDYLSLDQQPKNLLFSRYLNLLHFNDRYNEANETFKVLKKSQRTVGDPVQLEKIISELNQLKINYTEKVDANKLLLEIEKSKIIEVNKKIRDLHASKKPISELKYSSREEYLKEVKDLKQEISTLEVEKEEYNNWLNENFKKDIPAEVLSLNIHEVKSSINKVKDAIVNKKSTFDSIKKWIENNSQKTELNDSDYLKLLADSKLQLKEKEDRLLIACGENCPTCGSILKEADENERNKLSIEISEIKNKILEYTTILEDSNNIKQHNKKYSEAKETYSSLKLFLLNEKTKLEKLTESLSNYDNIKHYIELNSEIDYKKDKLEKILEKIRNLSYSIMILENELELFSSNSKILEYNLKVDMEINSLDNELNFINLNIDDIQYEINNSTKELILLESKIETELLNIQKIKEAEREYKKYSVYLQAVHRDGIPMKIIKSKLPVINNRINNIIKDIVNFKVELYITQKGDVKERFYFGDDKENSLPLSMSSGSQYFISVLAIRDALHSVSHLTKPNLCVIDEGFGSLDDEKTVEIKGILEYLKSKYRNLLIITHRNEIKDFVDYEIYISRKELGGSAWHSEISI